jgi:translation initiation factor IF-3
LDVKIKQIRKFLEQQDKVKISMMFRGREIVYTDIGRKIMEYVRQQLEDLAVFDQEPRLEGKNMIMIVSPKKS